MSGARRMDEVYRRRQSLHPPGYYSLFDPGQLYLLQRRESDLLRLLAACGIPSLRGKRFLDIGCGGGEWMLRFLLYGSEPTDLVGLEIQADRARVARDRVPALAILEADASRLPFRDGSFDLVHQATLLTLVLDPDARLRIAREMIRVLRPGGAVIWYDFRFTNPRNPDARGIGRAEIGRLFPACDLVLRRTTLLPPIARRLATWSPVACRALEWLPFLRSHYLGLIRPRG